jgi:hypothetical protein
MVCRRDLDGSRQRACGYSSGRLSVKAVQRYLGTNYYFQRMLRTTLKSIPQGVGKRSAYGQWTANTVLGDGFVPSMCHFSCNRWALTALIIFGSLPKLSSTRPASRLQYLPVDGHHHPEPRGMRAPSIIIIMSSGSSTLYWPHFVRSDEGNDAWANECRNFGDDCGERPSANATNRNENYDVKLA